jgi:hypothetical protein
MNRGLLSRCARSSLRTVVALVIVGSQASSLNATVLAQCGGSHGKALFLGAGEKVWSDDALSKGRFTFVADDKGNPNILFYDVTGRVTDVSADGGRVSMTYVDPEQSSFGMAVSYWPSGLVETYSVGPNPAGARQLLWTTNRPDLAGDTKVGAYEAHCAAVGPSDATQPRWTPLWTLLSQKAAPPR